MPLTPSVTSSQNSGDKEILTITDTSTGTDGSLTSRRVFLRIFNASYLVPTGTTTDYVAWAIGASSIDISVLDKDYAIEQTVQWLAGSSVVYEVTTLILVKDYLEEFKYGLTQNQTSNQRLLNSPNYFFSKIKLTELIDDAVQAVSQYSDQTTAQICLNEGKVLSDKLSNFY